MGESRLRVVEESKPAVLDFAQMHLPHSREFLRLRTMPDAEGNPADCEAMQIVRLLAPALIGERWPQAKLDRYDGRIWADWEAILDSGAPPRAEATIGLLAWMARLVDDEKLKAPWYLAAAREAFSDALGDAIRAAKGDGV